MIPLALENVLVFIAAIGLGLLAVYLLTRPLKWLFKWILNGMFGVILLLLLGTFGSGFGLEVPINAITIIISALLGIPGVVLILLKLLFL